MGSTNLGDFGAAFAPGPGIDGSEQILLLSTRPALERLSACNILLPQVYPMRGPKRWAWMIAHCKFRRGVGSRIMFVWSNRDDGG